MTYPAVYRQLAIASARSKPTRDCLAPVIAAMPLLDAFRALHFLNKSRMGSAGLRAAVKNGLRKRLPVRRLRPERALSV